MEKLEIQLDSLEEDMEGDLQREPKPLHMGGTAHEDRILEKLYKRVTKIVESKRDFEDSSEFDNISSKLNERFLKVCAAIHVLKQKIAVAYNDPFTGHRVRMRSLDKYDELNVPRRRAGTVTGVINPDHGTTAKYQEQTEEDRARHTFGVA